MGEYIKDEMRMLSHVVLLSTLTVFSIVLIALNVSLGWEKWVIPVFAIGIIICFAMHISGKPGERERLHLFSAFICLQIFYYTVNVDEVFSCSPIAILFVVLLSLTKERRIIWIFAATSSIAVLTRIAESPNPGRVIWHCLIILIASLVAASLVGETRRTEEIYSRYISVLLQQNRSADDFLANVSHEIRTPVNAVIGLAGVCIEREQDKENRENLKIISFAGKRISEQISDILDYSEIVGENLVVNKEDYRISTLAKEICNRMKVFMRDDLELIIDTDPQIPSVMRTDTVKLKRILWHVIMNGLKYSATGGVYVHFSTTPQEYGANLCIDITDTGSGMTEEEKERIYEHFYQSDSGRDRSSSGLGLGMSIAKGFVEALEGFISVESEPGAGTTVHICIPQEVVQDSPCMVVKEGKNMLIGGFLDFEKYKDPYIRESYSRMIRNCVNGTNIPIHKVDNVEQLKLLRGSLNMTHLFVGEEEYGTDPEFINSLAREMVVIVFCSEAFNPTENSGIKIIRKPFSAFHILDILNSDPSEVNLGKKQLGFSNVKVLVVDDESLNVMVTKNLLRRYGINADIASSGEEAVDMCRNEDYDLIFMDYMMPRMDGIEAAGRIRALKESGDGNVPAMVAFTADAVSTAKERFINEGFLGFLNKPVENAELEKILLSLLPESSVRYYDTVRIEDDPVPESISGDRDFDILRKSGIDCDKGMGSCLNDKDMYVAVLQEFLKDSGNKQKEMDRFFAEENLSDFTIRIHSVKSSSLMIGAEEVSRRAKDLEQAAKNGDMDFVKENYPLFVPEYKKTISAIAEAYGSDNENQEDQGLPV